MESRFSNSARVGRTRQYSEREPAVSLADKFNVIGGWLPPLMLIVGQKKMISRTQRPIPVENLTEALLRKYPVWEFCNDGEAGETLIRPVKKIPISSADSRLVGCELRLADGSTIFGYLGNVSLTKTNQNQHFLMVSVFVDGSIEHLARYHDFDFSEHGPSRLARKLGKKKEEVFPMSYDISALAAGAEGCIRGSIPAEPKKKLSRSEIIQLAVTG